MRNMVSRLQRLVAWPVVVLALGGAAVVPQLAAGVSVADTGNPEIGTRAHDYVGYQRGVALAGGSFGDGMTASGLPMTNAVPGVYGTDWFYDVDGLGRTDDAGLRWLAGRGLDLVRVDIRWERLQPTLDAPLDVAEVARISALLDAAGASELGVILDLHNYGHYKTADAPRASSPQGGWSLGEAALPHEALADVWRRVVEQWGDHPAVWGWELMNEPTGMAPTRTATSFVGSAVILDFENGTVPGQSGAALHVDVIDSAWVSLGSGDRTDHSDAGDVVGALVRLTPGSVETAVSLQLMDAQWQVHGGPHVPVPADGAWHMLTWRPPVGLLADHRDFAIHVGGASGAKSLDVDKIAVGAEAETGHVTGVQHWQAASQLAVEAIRAAEPADAHRAILVAGYNWSDVDDWASTNGAPWIVDPLDDPDRLLYTAHHYWDGDGDSRYGNDSPTSLSGSVDAHAKAMVAELSDFTSWLEAYAVRGAVTEVGWPDGRSADEWNQVAEAWFTEADRAALHVTAWATGAAWGDYDLALYEAAPGSWSWHAGDTISSANVQARVLESHLGQGSGPAVLDHS